MAADLPGTIGYEGSWLGRLRGKLYEQFKSKPNLDAIVQALAAQAQALEDAGQAGVMAMAIDPVTDDPGSSFYWVGRAAQLDRIGRYVGQPRGGVVDATFRMYLRAAVAAHISRGTPEDIYQVLLALFPGSSLSYVPGNNASFELRILAPTTDAEAVVALAFLGRSKDAGVRALLQTQEGSDAAMFTTARATYVTVATGGASTSLTCDAASLSAFPHVGSVAVDTGTATAETVAYASRTASSIIGSFTAAHAIGASVTLVGSPGLGFPVATYATGSSSAGDATLAVVATAAFPSGLALLIDDGMPTEETIVPTSVDGTHFHFTAPALLSQAHTAGCAVVLLGSGGKLARVYQAS
jgi:hypothetical protein